MNIGKIRLPFPRLQDFDLEQYTNSSYAGHLIILSGKRKVRYGFGEINVFRVIRDYLTTHEAMNGQELVRELIRNREDTIARVPEQLKQRLSRLENNWLIDWVNRLSSGMLSKHDVITPGIHYHKATIREVCIYPNPDINSRKL